MRIKEAKFGALLLLTVLLLTAVISVTSCEKKTEPVKPADVNKTASVQIEQTTCPVMGNSINKEIYTEYKGKKVYFCCTGCVGKFEENPEKYLSKLPQFNNK